MQSTLRLKTILGHLRVNTAYHEQVEKLSQNSCCASAPLIQDKEFRYTRNCSLLSRTEKQFYEDNGYLIVKNLVSEHVLNSCRDHFLDLCNGVCPLQGMFLMKEPSLERQGATGEHLYYKIQDLLYGMFLMKEPSLERDHFLDLCNGVCPLQGMFLMKEPSLERQGATGEHVYYKVQDILYDNVFSSYTALPKLLDYVQCFTGPNITAVHSMLINKPPDAQENTVHPLHQDLLYFPFRPADLIVGVWTAMETVDSDNGCLVVVPGSHKNGKLHRHATQQFQTGAFKTFYGVKDMQDTEVVPLHMEKGDTVFLHPLLIHGSGPNKSKRFRKAISCHYAASECEIINVEDNAEYKDVAREFEASASKSRGVPFDFATIMKLRCVVVRGSEGFTAL
ncbi:phytanoyl-CoA dioxygenase, peroxisomal-like [Homalodisca vitripennis]|uniref:phytanoyl-CoA dioxygenase, peroxisomal-like n=1 Tax=Homalodisca vitripennis TaxID=197043 RepID=UPI001EEAA45D|nr:phytanoyl-CoA dioxygenase, peroxisomal-like [Homalodisca vitripennis]